MNGRAERKERTATGTGETVNDGEQLEAHEYEHHDERLLVVDDESHPIVIVLSRGSETEPGQALCMSREDAVKLAGALVGAAMGAKGASA